VSNVQLGNAIEKRFHVALLRFSKDKGPSAEYEAVFLLRADLWFRKSVAFWGLDLSKLNAMHWETGNSCGERAQGRPEINKYRTTSDAAFVFSGDMAASFLRLGTRLGRVQVRPLSDGGEELTGSGSSPFPRRLVHVLDAAFCRNTRTHAWEANYYIYGMRCCDAPARRFGDDATKNCMMCFKGMGAAERAAYWPDKELCRPREFCGNATAANVT
jgi:hypothetical protein